MKIFFFSLLVFIFLVFPKNIYAEYVMPYPGIMPGNKLYKVSEIVDGVKGWWSFGNLAQYAYHQNLADKKLVEAKVLFEYKQYLLASKALLRYEDHVVLAKNALTAAKKERKDITIKQKNFQNGLLEQERILEKLKSELPEKFLWQPEKDVSQILEIHKMLDSAIENGRKLGQEKND